VTGDVQRGRDRLAGLKPKKREGSKLFLGVEPRVREEKRTSEKKGGVGTKVIQRVQGEHFGGGVSQEQDHRYGGGGGGCRWMDLATLLLEDSLVCRSKPELLGRVVGVEEEVGNGAIGDVPVL